MNIGAALIELCADSPGVSAPVYAVTAPQDQPAPYLVYQQDDRGGWDHLDGPSGLAQKSYQLDSYAETYEAARILADQARQILNGFRGTVAGIRIGAIRLTNEFDSIEDLTTPRLFRVTQFYLITHEEET